MQFHAHVQQVVDNAGLGFTKEIRDVIYTTTGLESVKINEIAIQGAELMKHIEEWLAR